MATYQTLKSQFLMLNKYEAYLTFVSLILMCLFFVETEQIDNDDEKSEVYVIQVNSFKDFSIIQIRKIIKVFKIKSFLMCA